MGKSQAHIRYRTQAGDLVPGVTTVLNILSKPALVPWANRLGLDGIDVNKYVDDKAAIGTLAHDMVACHLRGTKVDAADYSPNQVASAENCLLKFWDWLKAHPLKAILIEVPIVSEEYKFGGTIDCLAEMDGNLILLDFKTGGAIYPEYFFQLAAYKQLLLEVGQKVVGVKIVRIGRDDKEGFEERTAADLSKQWLVFRHCLAIYNLQKELRTN